MKKIINILLAGLLIAPVMASAAVTVKIGDRSNIIANTEVEIPVEVTGYDLYTAGQLTLDLASVGFESATVVNGNVLSGIEDYSSITAKANADKLNNWDSTKGAAIDYKLVPSTSGSDKLTIYFYAPCAQVDSECGANGTQLGKLFTIKGKLGATPKSGNLTLGGYLFTGKQAIPDGKSAIDSSTATFSTAIASADPVKPIDTSTEAVTGTNAITSTPLGVDASVVVNQAKGIVTVHKDLAIKNGDSGSLTWITTNAVKPEDATAKVELPPNTKMYKDAEKKEPYSGIIAPPVVTPFDDLTAEEKNGLPKDLQNDKNFVLISVGDPVSSIYYGDSTPALVHFDVARPKDAPAFKMYYIPKDGSPVTELAGVKGDKGKYDTNDDGVIDTKDEAIAEGGTFYKPETTAGSITTYHVVMLLSHMTDFGPYSLGDGDSSGCFIATAAFGSPMEPQVETLRAFRDQYLMTNAPGKAFVHTYYKLSPPMADFIAQHDTLRAVTRGALMPLIGVSSLMLYTGMGWTGLAFCLLGLAGLMLSGSRMVRRK